MERRQQQKLEQQLKKWRDDLVNLSRRNRLLYFKHTRSASLEIQLPPSSQEIFDRLNAGGARAFWEFQLPPDPPKPGATPPPPPPRRSTEVAVKDKTRTELLGSLRLLERKVNQEFVDKGLWTLYLGLGALTWIDSDDDKSVQSPLLLVPVTFSRSSLQEPFRLRRSEEDVVVNPALTIKLSNDFGISLPTVDELGDIDPASVSAAVGAAVGARKGWQVSDRTVLTTFTFHKEAMYRDLVDNNDVIAPNELIQMLALGPDSPTAGEFDFDDIPDEELDEVVRPEDLFTIRDADSSQRRAILAARDGKSFVVDGPPGTGKSQTITNVITELIGLGRTVLFVSEKAAALEVVQRRLQEAHLDDFVLELHSHNATRKAVAVELGQGLTRRPSAKETFASSSVRRLVRAREALSSYAQAMNEVRQPLERSLHEVLGRVLELQALPQAPIPSSIGATLDLDDLQTVLSAAETLARNWGPVERGEDFLWRDLTDTEMSATRRFDLERRVQDAIDALEILVDRVREVDDELRLGWRNSTAEAEWLAGVADVLEERQAVPTDWLTVDDLGEIEARIAVLEASVGQLEEAIAELEDEVGPSWRELAGTGAGEVAGALAAAAGLTPSFALAGHLRASDLASLAAFASQALEGVEQIRSEASSIAAAFGLHEASASLVRAADLAHLGSLAAAEDPPEPEWLSPAFQSAVDQATAVLGELLSEFRQQQHDLAEIFKPTVLDLDLDTLVVRFETVHTGFGRYKKAFREDKAALAPHTVAGKVTKGALARLPQAASWKALALRLNEAERRHASTLGAYYDRGSADFEQIGRAIAVARSALKIVGSSGDPGALRARLSRSGQRDYDLAIRANALTQSIDDWTSTAKDALGEVAAELAVLPASALAAWLAGLREAVDGAQRQVLGVDGVTGGHWSVGDAAQVLARRAVVADAEQALAKDANADSELLGSIYEGADTDWSAMRSALEWAVQLREVTGGAVRRRTAQALLQASVDAGSLHTALNQWRKAQDALVESFQQMRSAEVSADLATGFEDALSLLKQLQFTIGDIEVWALYREAVTQLEEQGLHATVEFCHVQRLSSGDITGVIERAVLEAWSDAVVRGDSERLSPAQSHERDALVAGFQELDSALIADVAARVINKCASRRPNSTAGAAGIIQREAQKKTRHMPIRELLSRAGTVAQQLKPVFMMSPLSVSQYLPSGLQFDVVVFDEASQVLPSDAINCVYRGRQLIVAGDQKQLPPSSFFMSIGADDEDTYDEEGLEDFESVLDLCKGAGGLRSLPLRWHYRSEHEALITYSNHRFYGGDLYTFPGPIQESPDLGIEVIHVDGVYRRGGQRDNPIEAQEIVDRVLFHRRNYPDLTLGVVTFSAAQEDAIVAELERRSASHPELTGLLSDDRLHGFFVKNLENVQGDERDIILFSVGYGPDENGKFTVQMGPLTKAGGWRRLNVAITRARRRVEVITSVLPGDFPSEVKADGVRHLKAYLDFGVRGPAALALDLQESLGDAESVLEEEVLRTIRSWGYEAVPQVGLAGYRIDIGVRDLADRSRFVLGVECDGAMYHSSKVARDRDRLRQSVIEGLGWKVHRIWGIAWFRDRTGQEARLQAAIEAAINGRGSRSSSASTVARPEVTVEEVDFDASPDWATEYVCAKPEAPRRWMEMHDSGARPELRRMIEEVLAVEAPVHEERVLRVVREAWGVGRSGARIKAAFDDAVSDLVARGVCERGLDGFLRGAEEFASIRVPNPIKPETIRTVSQVPSEELENAVYWMVSDAHSIGLAEIRQHVARLFGWNRTGSEISNGVEDAVDHLVETGYLVEYGEEYRTPAPSD